MACDTKWNCSWGLAIVAAAFVVNFIRDGIRMSFGMFFAVFIETFRKDAETTAWIGSLMLALMNFSAPVCSLLVTRFGCRCSTVLGSLLCFLGFLTSSFVPNIYFLYFSLGVVTGFGISLMFVAQTVIVVQYFKSSRTFAMGVSVCGSGVGGVFFTFLMTVLTSEYAWNGIMLILSGVMLEPCVAGMLMRPTDSEKRTHSSGKHGRGNKSGLTKGDEMCNLGNCEDDGVVLNTQKKHDIRGVDDHKNDALAANKYTAPLSTKTEEDTTVEAFETDKSDVADVLIEVAHDKTGPLLAVPAGNIHSRQKETIRSVYVTLLKDVKVHLFVLSQFFSGGGYMLPFTFVPLTALTLGYSKTQAAWLLTVASIASIVSRLAIGALGDLKAVKRTYLLTTIMGLCSLSCFVLAFSRSYALLVIMCCTYGIGSGALTIITPVVITDVFGDNRISEMFGLCLFGRGPGNLVGPPLAGLIFDRTGSTSFVFILGACAFLSATLAVVACVYMHEKSHRSRNSARSSP